MELAPPLTTPPALEHGAVRGLRRRLKALRSIALTGEHDGSVIRAAMDCHIVAFAFSKSPVCERIKDQSILAWVLNSMILRPELLLCESNLPDLGDIIRASLAGSSWIGETFDILQNALSLTFFFNAGSSMGGSKHKGNGATPMEPAPGSNRGQNACLLAQLLGGMFFGVYPMCSKWPTFRARVEIFRRVHGMAIRPALAYEFASNFPMTCAVACMEYCAHVIGSYMPVEKDLCVAPNGSCLSDETRHYFTGFFRTFSVQSDAVRQVMQEGTEQWDEVERVCTHIVEKHKKSCKKAQKDKRKQHITKADPNRIKDAVEMFSRLPYIVPYQPHIDDHTNCIISGELAFTDTQRAHASYHELAMMQRLISFHSLPSNLYDMQMRSMMALTGVCTESAMSMCKMYICVACMLKANCMNGSGGSKFDPLARGRCKMNMRTLQLVCSQCKKMDMPIISVSLMGRIVTIGQHQFYYAPCCGRVRRYEATGREFYNWVGCTRAHGEKPATVNAERQTSNSLAAAQSTGTTAAGSAKAKRQPCTFCPNHAIGPQRWFVDQLAGRMCCVRMCYRHTPHDSIMRDISNIHQLAAEAISREKPALGCTRGGSSGSKRRRSMGASSRPQKGR